MLRIFAIASVPQSIFQSDFDRFWSAHFATHFSFAITTFLVPYLAVAKFDASAAQMGLLVATQEVPVVLLSLTVGSWLDRVRLRPVIVAAIAVQALLVAGLAWVVAIGSTQLSYLYIAAFGIGATKLFTDLAGTTVLPKFIERGGLVHANSRLQVSMSAQRAIGPALGGFLATLSSVFGLVLAALADLLAAFWSRRLPNPPPAENGERNLRGDMIKGLRLLFQIRALRPMILSTCLGSIAIGIFYALLLYSLVRIFGLSGTFSGTLVALIGAATLIVSLMVPAMSRSLGATQTMAIGTVISTLGLLCYAYATATTALWIAPLGLILLGSGTALWGITQVSIRQVVTPAEHMGKVHGSRRLIVFGFLLLGSALGGYLADLTSVYHALLLAALTMGLAVLPLFSRALRQVNLA